ncbi:MAG: MBL fold metallo-hydrolase [Kiloniellales bacterium]|nr:MBL fold metallo-hydrolase [Kiloniellales bacterium]
MIFRQLFHQGSCSYSYLIASRQGGEACLVDPVLEQVDRYLTLLEELRLSLVMAIDTHLHADHVTGAGRLSQCTDCMTVMGRETEAELVSLRVADGEVIDLDGITLRALHTPGHTPDSYSFLLGGRVLTGDTLFIRGTGRTDFQGGDPAAQYESIFGRLLRLPDETLVFPGHDYKGDSVSTIGEERAFNPRLQVGCVRDYVDLMNGLNLPRPKLIDVALPANRRLGLPPAAPEPAPVLDLPGAYFV